MGSLIKKVKLSKKKLVVGESLGIEVKVSKPAVDVTVNRIYGASLLLLWRWR